MHGSKTKGGVSAYGAQTTLKASYSHHYRRGLVELLDVLEFSRTTPLRPVLDALGMIKRHADAQLT